MLPAARSSDLLKQQLLGVCFPWLVLQYPCVPGQREFLHFPPVFLVYNRILGDPGDHLSCLQAVEVLTASFPGKFKICL